MQDQGAISRLENVESGSSSIENPNFYPFYLYWKNRRRKSSLSQHQRRVRHCKRLVRKSGKSTLFRQTTPRHSYRYCLDLSNTLIDSHWKWTLLTLSLAFILTWLIFACFWMIISTSGDSWTSNSTNNTPCLSGIRTFAGYLLFSIETQSTIGYGNRFINHYCPEAVFLMCAQITVGVCVCGYMICIVYLKMTSPERLHSINCFSKCATICQRDGILCLVFRVRDCISRRYECHTGISAFFVWKHPQHPLEIKRIKLQKVGVLIWPVEVVHYIDEDSPLWDVSPLDLITKSFELIVTMEGISMTTSFLSRTTTSYLNKEILWGHKFQPCVNYNKTRQAYIVQNSLFHKTTQVDSPLCSAKRLREVFGDILSVSSQTNTSSPEWFMATKRIFRNLEENEEVEEDDSDDEQEEVKRVRGGWLGKNGRYLFGVLQRFVQEDNSRREGKYVETDF